YIATSSTFVFYNNTASENYPYSSVTSVRKPAEGKSPIFN
ncbi:adherence factor domain protein, partial [Chlamydia psittaci 09DC78]